MPQAMGSWKEGAGEEGNVKEGGREHIVVADPSKPEKAKDELRNRLLERSHTSGRPNQKRFTINVLKMNY